MAYPAQENCLEAHLARIGYPQAGVEFPKKGILRIRWPLTEEKVSIIIPTKDKVDYLAACITSILEKTSYPDYEIIIVDNGSSDPETLSYLGKLKSQDEPLGIQSDGLCPLLSGAALPVCYNFHRLTILLQ